MISSYIRGEILLLSPRRCHRSDYRKGYKMKKILLILLLAMRGARGATAEGTAVDTNI